MQPSDIQIMSVMDEHAVPPWEHHASATGLPRFNYKAVSTIPSLKGFLITCTLDREKSATKEAMGILREYLKSPNFRAAERSQNAEDDGNTDENNTSGEQHICLRGGQPSFHDGEQEEERQEATETAVPEISDDNETSVPLTKQLDLDLIDERHQVKKCHRQQRDAVNPKRTRAGHGDPCSDDGPDVFLLKMAQKGIISIFLESSISDDPVNVLSKVLEDIENGVKNPPQWCQRMVPIQASCVFSKESLTSVVVKLVKQHLGESLPSGEQPLKYAIGYNRRGIEATGVNRSKLPQDFEVLGRMDCIHLVTDAVAKAAPHTAVDLRAPQMIVILEVIPLAGVQDSPICGVAVVSGGVMNTKPKLCVKPLIPTSHRSKKSKH